MSSAFTNLTADLWTWEPWRKLEHDSTDMLGRCTRLFWLGLYTSHDAKRIVPGMFGGSIHAMAESAGVPVDDALRYLDRLLDHDMVEFDRQFRVLRLTQLPGCGDAYGSNGKVIRGWWNQFKKVPQCPVRDAHVGTLRWMLDQWSRDRGEPLSHDHTKAWAETFGRIAIPAPRRRGVRRFMDSDTGTPEQPSLFDPKPSGSGYEPSGSLSSVRQAASKASRTALPEPSEPNSVDNSWVSEIINKNQGPETLSKGFRNPWDPDPDQDPDQVLRSAEGGSGGGRTTLALVPLHEVRAPLDADELVEALADGTERCPSARAGLFPRAVTRAQREALGRAIDAIGAIEPGIHVPTLLRDYIAGGAPDLDFRDSDKLTLSQRNAGLAGITFALVTSPGWLSYVIGHAVAWAEKRKLDAAKQDEMQQQLDEAKRQLGF